MSANNISRYQNSTIFGFLPFTLDVQVNMSWKQKVARGFGDIDCIFAVHPLDHKDAQEAMSAAKAAGATFQDFEKEMVWHIYRKMPNSPGLHSHIKEQVATAKQMWQ
ncbi:TPA: hypothetical protein ACGBBZ_004803 [Escherichia coli]